MDGQSIWLADLLLNVRVLEMTAIDQLRQLPISERIQLVEDLWDTIASEEGSVPLSQAQTEELDRRLDRYEESPDEGVEWGAIKARIQNSL